MKMKDYCKAYSVLFFKLNNVTIFDIKIYLSTKIWPIVYLGNQFISFFNSKVISQEIIVMAINYF